MPNFNISFTLTLTLIIVFSCSNLFCQSAEIKEISSSGGSRVVNDLIIDWTLGQFAIATLENDEVILTQGLHQINLVVTILDNYLNVNDIQIYPNPANSTLRLKIHEINNLNFKIIGIKGDVLKKGELVIGINDITIAEFSSGEYTLRISDESSNQYISFKIIKL